MSFHTLVPRSDRYDGTAVGVHWNLTRPIPRLLEATQAIVARLDYTGVGATQFLVPSDGEPHLLELNPRVGMPAAIWYAFGFDTVLAACQLAGKDVGWLETPGYANPVGPHGAWASRETYGLLTALGRGEIGLRTAASWAATIARAAVTADAHLTWSWEDPLPSLVTWASVLSPRTWMPPRRS